MKSAIIWFVLSGLTAIGATYTLVGHLNEEHPRNTIVFAVILYFLPTTFLIIGLCKTRWQKPAENLSAAGLPWWPMLVCVPTALGLWAIYFGAKLDHVAIAQGDNSSFRRGLGAIVPFLFVGLILGAIIREKIGPKR